MKVELKAYGRKGSLFDAVGTMTLKAESEAEARSLMSLSKLGPHLASKMAYAMLNTATPQEREAVTAIIARAERELANAT